MDFYNGPMDNSYPIFYNDPDDLVKALELIKKAIEGEKEDEMFYTQLIQAAPTEEQKRIIRSIRDDEKKHDAYFREIYEDLVGDVPDRSLEVTRVIMPIDYISGLGRAFAGEVQTVKEYRPIREAMPNQYYRDILFEIITDELRHAALYNNLLIMNQNMTKDKYEDKQMNNKMNKGNKNYKMYKR